MPTKARRLRVLRIHQSGVVSAWRARDRELRARGVDVTLVSAARWDEGGRDVPCEPGADDFIVIARTVGRRPNVFLYDPRPLWRALRSGPFDLIDAHQEPCSLAAFEILCLRWLARAPAPSATSPTRRGRYSCVQRGGRYRPSPQGVHGDRRGAATRRRHRAVSSRPATELASRRPPHRVRREARRP